MQNPTPKNKNFNVKVMYVINIIAISVFVAGIVYKLIQYLN
ncbi:DUF6728 family protein [Pedobacter flavus]|uniref:DUF6728 family protein n=1 Tax=Pedobacter flavus TaxID=3113906 RepID=A0ABU7H179_9SPHI|nr:DUF6728 family protein [Pedobacter sp. VNH31]MEE1884296.1 DUF6728 family protein [Pedobacter sp. VNH31]